ncbi:MAG: UxaA family hydrolase [Burkholderiales bacterium]|nr:UxaA family hydrolase [Burkholderiales bacterium]
MGEISPQFIRAATLRLNPADDVVIAARELPAGTIIAAEGVTARQRIPSGHKLATRAVAVGQPVRRYNQIIGFATQPIAPGDHVHVHNIEVKSFERDYAFGEDVKPTAAPAAPATFMGIRRADGRVATRNYVGVISTVNCSATVSQAVAAHFAAPGALADWPNVDGVVALTHSSGCGMDSTGEGIDVLRRTIAGYATHANFAGVLLIGLGCEANQMSALLVAQGLAEGGLLRTMNIQDIGGTRKCIEWGVAQVREMLPIANAVKREPCPASHITIGLQCGGSDGYSGISANHHR